MFNFCLLLKNCSEEEKRKIAIAACFHDIALLLDRTVDYIPSSILYLKKYLSENNLESWSAELSFMVDMHHKVIPLQKNEYSLAEVFRKSDLIDFSAGFFNFGVSRELIKNIQTEIPNAGFHKFILKKANEWFLQHPFKVPPFMKW